MRVLAGFQPSKPCPQVIQKQRLDDLQDVLLGGVVRALRAALCGFHDRLKQRTKDCRRDGSPVEPAGVEQCLPHGSVKVGNTQRAAEQVAVHIRKAGQVFVQRLLAFVLRRIEYLKEPREP